MEYGPWNYIALLGIGLALLFLYPLPFFIAAFREKRAMFLIGAVNLFFGWTCFGWVICLAWALTAEPTSRALDS
jgi:hypothetical protein